MLFIDEAEYILCLCVLIECNDNYPDTSQSLWLFKIAKVPTNNADVITDNSRSFKYKLDLMEGTVKCSNKQFLEIMRNIIN